VIHGKNVAGFFSPLSFSREPSFFAWPPEQSLIKSLKSTPPERECRLFLALEDGRVFRAKATAQRRMLRRSVFNTSITGYQEIFSRSILLGQIVVLTNPQIGNYGTNQEDNEATRP